MKILFLIITITLGTLEANAFWSDGMVQVASLPKGKFIATEVSNANDVIVLNAKLQKCFDSCSVDKALLKQCQKHASTSHNKTKCINFAKRECLMLCKEKEFKKNTLSLLQKNK